MRSAVRSRLGFGSAPLGNMFRAVSDEDAHATVAAAWVSRVRFFDTAPAYGAGLAELRLGEALADHPRDAYSIATKVGRIVQEDVSSRPDAGARLFASGRPHPVVADYSADATLRSIEDSMTRLRTDRLDVVWVHDVAQNVHGDAWLDHLATCRTGAFRVLDRLRDAGVIGAWGVATNPTEPIELVLALDEVHPDGFLLACGYTLLEHDRALERLLPAAVSAGVDMVVGGPYNSGILAGGPHFDYGPPSDEVRIRVDRLRETTVAHGVSLKAAALQFCLAHPAAVAVVPGATRPGRVVEDAAAVAECVPAQFWQALRNDDLISPGAPVPVSPGD
ncbi:aldo/keto reductase [Jatrophihabitans sp. YIM 134969]